MSAPRSLLLVPILLSVVGCGGDPRVPAAPPPGVPVSRAPAPIPVHVSIDEAPATGELIASATASAQPPVIMPAAVPLSREQCVRLALVANRSYLQRAGARERARLSAEIALAERYRPMLRADYTAVTEAPDGGSGRVAADLPLVGVQVTPFATSNWTDDTEEYTSTYGVALSRRVFALSEHARLRLPLSQAEVDYLAAAYELLAEAKRLERDVTRAFLAVQNAQARVRVRQERVTDAKSFLDNVEQNVELGFRPRADRLFADISLNQAEADLVRERAAERDAIERLLNLLSMPLDASIDLQPEDLNDLPHLPANFASDLALVLHRHEEILVQDARLDLLDQRQRVTRDEVAPEVTATFTAERRMTGTGPFGTEIEDDDRLSLRFDLNLPLDGQRVERARLEQIRRQILDQRLERAQIVARLEQELRATWRSWERSRTEAELAVARVIIERDRLEAVLARYEAGEVDNLEVTRAKQSLDDAEVRLLDARIGLVNTAAEYRALLPAVWPDGTERP